MRLLYFLSTNLGGLIIHHWSGWLLDTSLRLSLISISIESVSRHPQLQLSLLSKSGRCVEIIGASDCRCPFCIRTPN